MIHPDVAARFPMLDGPDLDARGLRRRRRGWSGSGGYESWEPEEAPPVVEVRDDVAPGPHGPVPVRVYEPPAGGADGAAVPGLGARRRLPRW